MKQYCKFCCRCFLGDVYYCNAFDKVLTDSGIKHPNNCKEFILSEFGDVDTGKPYKPRERKEPDIDENQMKLFEE